MALRLELTDTFYLWVLSICFNLFVLFSCNSMPRSGCSALHGVNPKSFETRCCCSITYLKRFLTSSKLKRFFTYTAVPRLIRTDLEILGPRYLLNFLFFKDKHTIFHYNKLKLQQNDINTRCYTRLKFK